MRILEEFWYGNIEPTEYDTSSCKDNYMNEQKDRNFTINEKGSIVVHNYCAMALPQITVTLRSGQTTYRFNGSYDGNRSLPAKMLDRMVKDEEK